MKLDELYQELKEAYSVENLNELSSGIISLYRSQDIGKLRKVHAYIYNGDQGEDEQLSRIFSRIIMLYHPDRQEQIGTSLDKSFSEGDMNGLQKLDHILDVRRMDLTPVRSEMALDADFDSEDIWDYGAEGYSYIDDEDRYEDEYDRMDYSTYSQDFIAAVKRKVYGQLNVDFPVHLLADMEIIEMSEYEIENLDGIEYCTYARIVDLSANNLTDIGLLTQLLRLEEVYLQNNQITYVDSLADLPYLRVVDLSFNDINDISPLFELHTLEFINLIGNRIPAWQLDQLGKAGVVVVF